MPSIVGKYQHYKNENIDEYFIAVGVPLMVRKMIAISSPVIEFKLEGDTMNIKTSSLIRTVEHTFKLGEEYVEVMPRGSVKSVTTIVNENEVIVDSIIDGSGDKCRRHYLFTDDGVVETLTHEKTKNPSRRYFRRIIEE